MGNNSNFMDLPAGKTISFDCTIRDRVTGVCYANDACTIANAIHGPSGRAAGIIRMESRGVSRTWVNVELDPAVHPWAIPGMWYRCRMPKSASDITKELDSYADRPKQDKAFKATLTKLASALPNGLDVVWATITLVSPCPSQQQKGYKTGKSGTNKRSGNEPKALADRDWGGPRNRRRVLVRRAP